MASAPHTPLHSRGPSVSVDISFTSPSPSGHRRLSSAQSPQTPRGQLLRTDSMGLSVNGGEPAGNGLGNLADELADAWSEGEDEEYDEDMEGEDAVNALATEAEVAQGEEAEIEVNHHKEDSNGDRLVPPSTSSARGHKRQGSDYDGSDYGDASDLENEGIPPSLQSKMDLVESLARRGTESVGSKSDGVIVRVVDHLQDLGGQSGVEGSAGRLITTHTALSTHLLHQTRLLHTLTYPIFSPLTAPPTPETIDELLPLLATLSEDMPRPALHALPSLVSLHTLTSDLIQSLSYLSDTLHMSKQTTTTATRRLKSARELVADMRREEEEAEEGEKWLRSGNWSERLKDRDCARVCGDVVGGFEEVCEGWRKRLVAQAEGTVVA